MKNNTSKILRRTRNLTDQEADQLITQLTYSHYEAARDNESISRSVFRASWEGSGDVMKAIAAASLTIGEKHGPLHDARALLFNFEHDPDFVYKKLRESLNNGIKVPGLGNSFFKDRIDPAFVGTYNMYCEVFADVYGIHESHNPVNMIWTAFCRLKYGRELAYGDKGVYPNAALITGAVVNLCEGVPYIENWVFLNGRVRAWIESLSLPGAPK